MPVFKNNDETQGRYVVSPDGRIVYHEASQLTKVGWRDAEIVDIKAAPREQLVRCGYMPATVDMVPPTRTLPPVDIKVSATGTVADAKATE